MTSQRHNQIRATEAGGDLPIDRLLAPLRTFIHDETSAGILLIAATVVALIWANSRWGDAYVELWNLPCTLGIGGWVLTKPLLLWINDGLMAMFFFVVGLEIKREVMVGELSTARGAALPLAAALGGMVVPALIYVSVNPSAPDVSGWGIPMATDIAFALGVLILLGDRAPAALKVFLTALAIVDDLGAVLIIALFYTSKISWFSLGLGAVFLGALVAANWLGIRKPLVYGLLGIGGLWLAFLISGVHPTIAGVLAAMAIPARTRLSPASFVTRARELVTTFERAGEAREDILTNPNREDALSELGDTYLQSTTPLQRLEKALHPWVSTVVLPIFALANAGVTVEGSLTAALSHSVTLGVILGLVVGKQVGVALFAWFAVRLGWASLPRGVTWLHISGVAWLCGIGFTMSLFIAGLAFGDSPALSAAKVGILAASLVAGCLGAIVLRRLEPISGA